MPDRVLNVKVTGDTRGLERAFGRTSKTAKVFGQRVEKAGVQVDKTFSRFSGLGSLAGGFAGGAAVTIAFQSIATAAKEAEQVLGQTSVAVENAGLSWEREGRRIKTAAVAISRASAFDDEDVLRSFGVFVRSQKNVAKSLELTQLAADVARARFVSLDSATQLVNKAALGQVGALRRVGIAIDKNASSTEALSALQRTFAGSAAQFANSSAGALDRLNVQLEEAKELIGGPLLKAVGDLATKLETLVTTGNLAAQALGNIGKVKLGDSDVAGVLGKWIELANPLTLQLKVMKEGFDALGLSADKAASGVGGGLDALRPFLGGFRVPQQPGAKEPKGFGDPGFKPKGFQFVTGLGPKAQSNLAIAERTKGFADDLKELARQKRVLQSALGQAGLSDQEKADLQRDLTGVIAAMRSINEQITASAKEQADSARDTAEKIAQARLAASRSTPQLTDDLQELIRQRNETRRQLNTRGLSTADKADLRAKLSGIVGDIRGIYTDIAKGLQDARKNLQAARLERLDLIQNARDVAREVRDSRESLNLAKQIGGTVGIRTAQERVQDAQLARRRLRLQGVTFSGAGASTGTVQTFGNVSIRIESNQDPVKIAQQVLAELRKKNRRTAPQQRGRQPGERIGGV